MKKITIALVLGILLVQYGHGQPRDRSARNERSPEQTESTQITRRVAPGAGSPEAPLLFCIGLHIEPLGASVSELAGRPEKPDAQRKNSPAGKGGRKGDYTDARFFDRHVNDIRSLAAVVAAHRGLLTVQAQTPFTRMCVEQNQPLLGDLLRSGHEIALHFHEDAHLGIRCENLPPATWTAVMKEEISWINRACPGANIFYWSGGNNYRHVLAAAADSGLKTMSDHKNPRRQQTFAELLAINPWRPAGGPTENSVADFARHDPAGKIVYLPDGIFSGADFSERKEGGAGGWFDAMTEGLELSLKATRKDRVNVFHITLHPGQYRGGPKDKPYETLDQWLTQVVDPLVRSGKVKWATFSQTAAEYARWEKTNPGVDPRAAVSTPAASAPGAGYITFAINVHDWVDLDESADTLLRLVDIFRKYNVRGDFYFIAPIVEKYAEKRPDVIRAIKDSGMTVSFHIRPPHPAYAGFDADLKKLDEQTLATTLRDYETYALDLSTGGIIRNKPGGYSYIKQVFGAAPVCVSPQTGDRRIKSALAGIYREMGAQMIIKYHETGTDPSEPYEYLYGLLVRPSDFSITRWTKEGEKEDSFWWNRLYGPRADPSFFDPVARLKKELAAWKGSRPPFITALIHENNFYHGGQETWKSYYVNPDGNIPRRPPYRLDLPDPGRMRSAAERAKILDAYERLVAYGAANLTVVTSADIVRLAPRR